MRLVTFTSPDQPPGPGRVGVLAEGRVVDIFATQYVMARHRGDGPECIYVTHYIKSGLQRKLASRLRRT